MQVRGRDTVKEWGEMLKAEHRPTNPLELPDFMKPKPVPPAAPPTPPITVVEPPRPAKSATAATPPNASPVQDGGTAVCATCGKELTPKVAKFCQDNAKRFRGKLYCYNHQPAAKKA